MRGCASKTGTGRIVMIITIRQLNPPLGCIFAHFLYGIFSLRKRNIDYASYAPERRKACLRPEQLQEAEFKLCNEGWETAEY